MESVERDVHEVLFDELHRVAYQGSPLAFTILGPKENINRLSRSQMVYYREKHYIAPRVEWQQNSETINMGKIEYIAVQCFQCHAFQVAQQTKANKWSCKICNSKQTVRKIFAISYQAKDIRPIVQDLNLKRGEIEKNQKNQKLESDNNEDLNSYLLENENNEANDEPKITLQPRKWAKYVPTENNQDNQEDEEPDVVITTMMPEKKKRGRVKKDEEGVVMEGSQKAPRGRKRKAEQESYEDWNDEPVVRAQPTQRRKQLIQEDDNDEPPRSAPPITRAPPTRSQAPTTAPASSKWNKFTAPPKQPVVTSSKWSKFVSAPSKQDDDEDDDVITDPSAFYGRQEEYL
jgi:hypothetical protein